MCQNAWYLVRVGAVMHLDLFVALPYSTCQRHRQVISQPELCPMTAGRIRSCHRFPHHANDML